MNAHDLVDPLRRLHDDIRSAVIASTEAQRLEELASVRREQDGDTIYAVDVVSEDILLDFFEKLSAGFSFVLIAEGLHDGPIAFPRGSDPASVDWRIIVDPIDGTRGLMYQKRSAWILTGAAPNRGPQTSLQDIVAAVQTEIPLVKQHLSDQLWALKGEGAQAERFNRVTGERSKLQLRPSNADTIAHGFATISRFFPGARDELAAMDEEVVLGALGPVRPGKAHCFEDQYISSGGQLYELMSGHDRFIADLRPMMETILQRRGLQLGICCHPYDLCTALIATELGVVVTDAHGAPLSAPLNVETDVAWAGYANEQIRRQIEPLLQDALRRRGMIGSET
ncbi:MAG TPA: inositol monophosphatase [Terriglobia bacterium]|nr:inositol monophosphatase [Terriglobia bacterium]